MITLGCVHCTPLGLVQQCQGERGCKYQLVVVFSCEIRMSVGKQEQLAVGVNGEETQEVLEAGSYKESHRLGLGLRHRLGPTVGLIAAVSRYADG